jgi:hypothetical protein
MKSTIADQELEQWLEADTVADARHFVKGNRGVSEWTFTGTLHDGTPIA